jgi:GDP-L-fucose synthase
MKSRVLVTGENNLVGSAIKRIHRDFPSYDFNFTDSDLVNPTTIEKLFIETRPEYVIHTAIKQSGPPEDIFAENLFMNALIVHASVKFNIRKLVAFAQPSIYSLALPEIVEHELHYGTPSNALGEAQRILDKHISLINKEFGSNHTLIIPATLYGIEHNEKRFIPGTIYRAIIAKNTNGPLVLPIDGTTVREVVYADDVAFLAINIMQDKSSGRTRINITSKQEVSYKRIVETVCHHIRFDGEIKWGDDKDYPPRFPAMSSKNLQYVHPNFVFTSFEDGIRNCVKYVINKSV